MVIWDRNVDKRGQRKDQMANNRVRGSRLLSEVPGIGLQWPGTGSDEVVNRIRGYRNRV